MSFPLCSSYAVLTHYSAICMPIAVLLWVIGLLIFFGLPSYYHQAPGKVPSFYKSVFRRKIILWNFVVVILQNFFLSAPYGRNWSCKCTPKFIRSFYSNGRYYSPLELGTRKGLASRNSLHRVLWLRMGWMAIPIWIPLQTP